MKAILGLLSCLALVSASMAAAAPLPGQLVVDPDHPQWLMRHGGSHVFICGPGDPEDFLYVGTRRPDGTRDGDQAARIAKLIEHGGNSIYMQIVRTHGGDAKQDRTQNPFVDSNPARGVDERILAQWEQWFTQMDEAGVLIYLFFYDDSARVWNTGDTVGPPEEKFIKSIIERFKHHRNLIWIVGEESEERYTNARVQAIARVIQAADDHGHLIGDHHHNGTTFKAWQPDGALNHFSMQLAKTGDEAHAGAVEALRKAAGRYQIIYSESTAMPTDVDGMRHHAWAVAMGGVMPMLLRMDIAATPVEALQQCRRLQTFFEATDFWTMGPHDELKGSGTKYVLADPGRSYVAYADTATSQLGVEKLTAGPYALTWLDCRTGNTVTGDTKVDQPGGHAFDKPPSIGPECAVWIRRTAGGVAVAEEPRRAMIPASALNPASTVNRPPVAESAQAATHVGKPAYIQLGFEDDDGPGPYAYTIVRAPAHGTLAGDDNDRTYTPAADFTGIDEFAWKVNDSKADSNVATVTITVGNTPAAQADYYPPSDAAGGWRALKDADEIRRVAGMDKAKLDEALAFIKGSTKHGGLLVLRHGWLVYENYFGLGDRAATPNLASCGKSFTSIAVGILMSERPELFRDGLDQKVFTPDYFPAEAFPLSDPRKKDIKLGQLLAFSAGIRGNNPCYVNGKPIDIKPVGPDGWQAKVDELALGKRDGFTGKTPISTATLWCNPGEGYSYASCSIHLASIMLRHVTGTELQAYVQEHLAGPLGWSRWGYGYKNAPDVTHTPGGGGIVMRSTDVLRFGYLLLHEGRWGARQLVPAEYVRLCGRESPYNPHFPYSLQFNVNTRGDVPELPRDAFWKSGSGGHALYIVPSLDLVVWKLGGRDSQYSPNDTGLPASPAPKAQVVARKDWKETVDKDTALRRTLELVIKAIEP